MGRVKRVFMDFVNSFFGVRLLCFVLVQLTMLLHYTEALADFCVQTGCRATPYVLPFLVQNYYFVFIYGISCVYVFAEVPYLHSGQLYPMMRMGREKWLRGRLAQVWLTAFSLTVTEFLLTVAVLLPYAGTESGWGKVWYSLSLTDAGGQYNITSIGVPYHIINYYTPVQAISYTLFLMFLVTGFLGTAMYVWSLHFSRGSAVLFAGVLCVMTLVYANINGQAEFIVFLTPLEWMDLMVLDGQISRVHPVFVDVVAFITAFTVAAAVLCTYRIKHMDIHLKKEE